jgi:hypothetical protein
LIAIGQRIDELKYFGMPCENSTPSFSEELDLRHIGTSAYRERQEQVGCRNQEEKVWTEHKLASLTMGLSFSRIFDKLFGKKEMRILMVGLDAAGKVRRPLFAKGLDSLFIVHWNESFCVYEIVF